MNHIMILAVLVACGASAGCAQRAATPAPAAPVKPSTQPASIEDARRLGYTLVTRDGEELFCRTQPKTGSRVARETVCLTAKELQRLGEESRRQINEMSRRTTPPPSR